MTGHVPPTRAPDAARDQVPTIVDTDVGGDPDDALALAAAAHQVANLALVTTCDERGGDRARFARHLLDVLGRPDVPVVAGRDLGGTGYFCVGDLFPAGTPAQRSGQHGDLFGDVVGAVKAVCDRVGGPVRWIGLGPLTNLATVLTVHPGLADRLVVTQTGGAIRYRDPTRAEHNFRLDPQAAHTVLRLARGLRLVTSDITFNPAVEITAESRIYRALAAPGAPEWARLLRAHLDRWFADAYPATMQHDALTLSAALHLPFVAFDLHAVTLDPRARMRRDPRGNPVSLSVAADHPAFMAWLHTALPV